MCVSLPYSLDLIRCMVQVKQRNQEEQLPEASPVPHIAGHLRAVFSNDGDREHPLAKRSRKDDPGCSEIKPSRNTQNKNHGNPVMYIKTRDQSYVPSVEDPPSSGNSQYC